jgi:4-amino-4-deoxy-L-arabinose transferase-like glycosyltransferase
LIGINIFLSAWYILRGDIFFHTDIARDFLVLGDIVKTHHLTLIGPRAGGITGVFHGPLWFYINLPIFIVSHGNPVAVGWFWVGLSITSIIVTYFVAKKMFDEMTALLSALLVSIVTITSTSNMFNPFGAVIVFPIYYYLFNEYLKTHKIQTLLIALFTLGIIIQFQMAFGIPLLLLSLLYLGKDLYKQKKLSHLFSVFILIIPLSTFILFDIKHSFMQIRSVFFLYDA